MCFNRYTVEIDGHAVSDRYFRAEADSYIYREWTASIIKSIPKSDISEHTDCQKIEANASIKTYAPICFGVEGLGRGWR